MAAALLRPSACLRAVSSSSSSFSLSLSAFSSSSFSSSSSAASKAHGKHIIIFGAPVTHLSTGDLLRLNIYHGSELGAKAATFMKAGALVPDNVVTEMLLAELKKTGDKPWLLDGYPRTVEQAKALDKGHVRVDMVLSLDVPTSVIVDRIRGRYVHLASGRVYNLEYNPPKTPNRDDVTGEPLTKREDDTEEAVTKRLAAFAASSAPLLALYEAKGLLRRFTGNTSDEIYAKVKPVVANLFGAGQ